MEKINYQKQGTDFLATTGTTLEVVEAVPQTAPLWHKKGEKHGIKYSVTLKNTRGAYTFDFWGCTRDSDMLAMAESESTGDGQSSRFYHVADFVKEQTGKKIAQGYKSARELPALVREAIKPTAYDVLACLSPLSEDNFTDWCASNGYDVDSITAERTYRACVEQDRNMRRLFTHEQLEALAEIN